MMIRGMRRLAAPLSKTLNARMFSTKQLSPLLTKKLNEIDPEIADIIEKEKKRQYDSLTLIPSENYVSPSVLEALGSIMQNKYSEGYPGQRYYGGNEFIDQAELLCQKRALEVYRLDPEKWGVNVQCLSGSPANFSVYTAVLGNHERMMALDLPHGGHLSHGYQTPTKKISAVSTYFECLPYHVNESGTIDYEGFRKNAKIYRPKLIVMGASAYARHIDYKYFRDVADEIGALLMCDMAHVSGLVAAGVMPSPFDFADIVTSTTHKSLRGPRSGLIFMRKGVRKVDKKGNKIMYDLEEPINFAVFPGHQGGPHNHTISALAVAFKQALSPEFKQYQEKVLSNSKAFADALTKRGYNLVSGGTDNHMCLVNVKDKGVGGAKVERLLELCNIAINKNTVPGDTSALNPGGIRMGTPAPTTRGMDENDMDTIAGFIDRAVQMCVEIQKAAGKKTMKAFNETLASGDFGQEQLKSDITAFARSFPPVAFTVDEMKYK